MTGHTVSPQQRAAFAKLDRDTLRAVAVTYRARRQQGASDLVAHEAALAELRNRVPDLPDLEARAAVSLIIALAATEAQAWFWRGTAHGWPPPWQPPSGRAPTS